MQLVYNNRAHNKKQLREFPKQLSKRFDLVIVARKSNRGAKRGGGHLLASDKRTH